MFARFVRYRACKGQISVAHQLSLILKMSWQICLQVFGILSGIDMTTNNSNAKDPRAFTSAMQLSQAGVLHKLKISILIDIILFYRQIVAEKQGDRHALDGWPRSCGKIRLPR
jgi:hypothetical protein